MALVPWLVVLTFLFTCDWFTLVDDDGLCQYQPLLWESQTRLLSGEFPLWSHWTGCGYPLLARSAVFYPPHWLAHGLCALLGLKWQEIAVSHFLHLGAAAAAAFLYLRVLNVGRWPASIAAVSYSMAGPMLGMDTNWNEFCFLSVYFPLAFAVIEQLVAGNCSWFWPYFCGLIASWVYVGTGVLGLFKFCLIFGLYFLGRYRVETFRFCLTRMAIAVVLALLGCIGPLAATLELLRWSTRLPESGLSPAMSLGVMTCAPEFFRGFVYPLVEFDWISGNDWSRHFNGSAVFAGPLALLGVCLALAHARSYAGPHRTLLALLVVYGLFCLGVYWQGNLLLQPLPFLKQHRWPVRWTVEFCALAALLLGVALDLGVRHAQSGQSRAALLSYVVLVVIATTTRTALSTEWESRWTAAAMVWILVAGLLACVWQRGHFQLFHVIAFIATIAAVVVTIGGAQRMRWASLRQLHHEPLTFHLPSSGRVLYLSSRAEQRDPPGEGNLSYCLPHLYRTRTVLTYGPFQLMTQIWQAGINSQGEIEDEEATASAFLHGHLLKTLRIGYVVTARDNDALNRACRDHPHLHLDRQTLWKNIYRHTGPQQPAFCIRIVRPESELSPNWDRLGSVDLARECYVEDTYLGPREFTADGVVANFLEQNNTISFDVLSKADQLVVVTTTWYPGWVAYLNGVEAPIYRVNGSFMAVQTPAGANTVRLVFRPTRIIILCGLSAEVLVGMIVFCGLHSLNSARRKN